jgi:hypothetical protein
MMGYQVVACVWKILGLYFKKYIKRALMQNNSVKYVFLQICYVEKEGSE